VRWIIACAATVYISFLEKMMMYKHFVFMYRCVTLLLVCGMVAWIHAEGSLTVKTDPDGIEVWLDDQFVGQSPIIEKKVKSGRYTLKLVDPAQHSSMSEEVLIQDNEETVVERTITSKFGSLKVTSEPEGAEVSIATDLGKTPLTNDFMNPGRYRLEIRPVNSRYFPKITEVTITRGESASINETLKKQTFFTKKNIASLCLTAGTVGGFVWGLVSQGDYMIYKERHASKSNGAELSRTLGIIIGSSCLVGLEIIALF
jgi:hypothetical protein